MINKVVGDTVTNGRAEECVGLDSKTKRETEASVARKEHDGYDSERLELVGHSSGWHVRVW